MSEQNLRISNERIKHMHGVAEFMYEHYDEVECFFLSRDEIYLLGLVHDIGYLHGPEGHDVEGAILLAGLCKDEQPTLVHCINWHGETPLRYMETYQCKVENIPGELILLWAADMAVQSSGPAAGKVVGYDERLRVVQNKWGKRSQFYRDCEDRIRWLRQHCLIKM